MILTVLFAIDVSRMGFDRIGIGDPVAVRGPARRRHLCDGPAYFVMVPLRLFWRRERAGWSGGGGNGTGAAARTGPVAWVDRAVRFWLDGACGSRSRACGPLFADGRPGAGLGSGCRWPPSSSRPFQSGV